MAKNITARVWELAETFVDGMGLLVYDVIFVKEKGEKILRLFIDRKEGNVTIDECEEVSNKMSELLDEENFIDDKYVLEVSSPGIERQLKYDWHFERVIGSPVDVRLYEPVNGRKTLTGRLISGGEKKNIVIECDGEEIEIERQKAAEVKIHFEF